MSGWLLDTNTVSGLLPNRSDRNAIAFVSSKPSARLYLSAVTIAEIELGIELQPRAERRQALKTWLENDIRAVFGDRVLAIDDQTLLISLRLARESRKKGKPLPYPDVLIAATALHHSLTVASRDVRPYRAAGCDFVNPWDP